MFATSLDSHAGGTANDRTLLKIISSSEDVAFFLDSKGFVSLSQSVLFSLSVSELWN